MDNIQNATLSQYSISGCHYWICNVHDAYIYTDGGRNITITKDRALVPFVSWQWREGATWQWKPGDFLSDEQNELLTGKTEIQYLPRQLKGNVLSLLTAGGARNNYNDWLYDCLPRYALCKQHPLDERAPYYLVPSIKHAFQHETLSLLGISQDAWISSVSTPHVHADTLVACSHPNPDLNNPPEWIITFLRNSFLRHGKMSVAASPLVFIDRSDTKKRALHGSLHQNLTPLGFRSYRLSTMPFVEQIGLFSQARVIVGVHGSGLANLAFASKGCLVIEIFANSYTPSMHKVISAHLGLKYAPIFVPPLEETPEPATDCPKLDDTTTAAILDIIRSELESAEARN